jgi:hypothetical protein
MEDDSRRFDEDEMTANFAGELEFDELDEAELSAETELLVARVRAARYAGA